MFLSLEQSFLRQFAHQFAGIVLDETKTYLLEQRLTPLLKEREITPGELVNLLIKGNDEKLRLLVITALTTHETMFFRDTIPFHALKKTLLPQILKTAKQPLRIWSAACSTGQEIYSLAMILKWFEMEGICEAKDYELRASDLCPQMLNIAREGIYSGLGLSRGLDDFWFNRFFDQLDKQRSQITSALRQKIVFFEHNLLNSAGAYGRFDLILLRNVLIYFSEETRVRVLEELIKNLNQGGYLMLGSAELLPYSISSMERVNLDNTIFYRKLEYESIYRR